MRELHAGESYHIFNRGVEKRKIFMDGFDYERFLRGLRSFNNNLTEDQRDFIKRKKLTGKELSSGYPELSSFFSEKPVEIIAYCLNPNHFHLILKQLTEDGITKFMHKLGTGYTNYFNKKHKHSGHVFESTFKSKHIQSNEYLLWLSVYVNLNYEVHQVARGDKIRKAWVWSSCREYVGSSKNNLCNKNVVLGQFKNDPEEYKEYCRRNFKKLIENKKLKSLFLE